MDPQKRQEVNPRHQPETLSTAILQTFENSEGGCRLIRPRFKHGNGSAAVGRVALLLSPRERTRRARSRTGSIRGRS
jgi:hypothetical protein